MKRIIEVDHALVAATIAFVTGAAGLVWVGIIIDQAAR